MGGVDLLAPLFRHVGQGLDRIQAGAVEMDGRGSLVWAWASKNLRSGTVCKQKVWGPDENARFLHLSGARGGRGPQDYPPRSAATLFEQWESRLTSRTVEPSRTLKSLPRVNPRGPRSFMTEPETKLPL